MFGGLPEKSVVARVLLISRKAYYMLKDGADIKNSIGNAISLIDELSAVLSHAFDEKAPARKFFSALKRHIKSKNKPFYPLVKSYFAASFAAPEYDEEFAKKHIPAIIYANDLITAKIVSGELDKAKSMCSAMGGYPGFIFGEYPQLSASQFYDLVFGYYTVFYDDEFMDKMKYLFEE